MQRCSSTKDRPFEVVRRFYPEFQPLTLGHVLTALEDAGRIGSAADVLNRFIADGHYRWAPLALREYQRWRDRRQPEG